jgi:hypothetical protein
MMSYGDIVLWASLLFVMYKNVHWYRVSIIEAELNQKLRDKIAELETIIIIHGIKNESKH